MTKFPKISGTAPKFVKAFLTGLGTILVFAVVGTEANADNVKFHIRNSSPYTVHVEFYSKNYNRVWPGDGQVYVLSDSKTTDFSLACASGEKICYGAWTNPNRTKWWGKGYKGKEGCDGCCGFCGGDVQDINLILSDQNPPPSRGQRID